MDNWAEAMQDDCYLIAADGWVARPHRVLEEVMPKLVDEVTDLSARVDEHLKRMGFAL